MLWWKLPNLAACKACQNVGLVNALSGFLTITEVAQEMFLTKIDIREIEKRSIEIKVYVTKIRKGDSWTEDARWLCNEVSSPYANLFVDSENLIHE